MVSCSVAATTKTRNGLHSVSRAPICFFDQMSLTKRNPGFLVAAHFCNTRHSHLSLPLISVTLTRLMNELDRPE
jgi:hypothetical protein